MGCLLSILVCPHVSIGLLTFDSRIFFQSNHTHLVLGGLELKGFDI